MPASFQSRLVSLRTFIAIVLILAGVTLLAERSAIAADEIQTMNFDQTMEVNEIGEAVIAIKMKLTASQFQMWQGKYGQNKSLLKRDMNKVLSQYETYDWNVSENQMEREVTVTLKAKGSVIHKGRGTYEFRVPKEWRGGDRNNNVFSFNYIESLGPNAVGQYNVRLTLPKNADNFREQLSEQGEKVIQYTVSVASGGHTWMLVTGIIFALVGAGVVGLGVMSKSDAHASMSHVSVIDRRPALTHARPIPSKARPVDPESSISAVIPLEQTTMDRPIDRK